MLESKHSQFSLNKAMLQALAYMLASPNANAERPQPTFSLIANGSDFRFLKVIHQSSPVYSVFSIFSLVDPGNDLDKVLQSLKGIAQQVLRMDVSAN
ncbi:MAG: hypothetical protein VKJ64_07335 [Leptolyngbyaceae bacterium]|nr:hypothetical protein [Leptolyngbyaceae bacterium]